MPYINESANHVTNQHALTEAKEMVSGLRIRKKDYNWPRLDENNYEFNLKSPKNVIVVDGSKYLPEEKKLLNMLCLLNVDQCIINIEQLKKYLIESFPDPKEYKTIFNHKTIAAVLPMLGISNETYEDEYDFFRFSFFSFLNNENTLINELEDAGMMFEKKETLLQTLCALAQDGVKIDALIQPCKACKRAGFSLSTESFINIADDNYFGKRLTINCRCKNNSKEIFISDLLGLHEQFDEDMIPSLTSQMMLIIEKLVLINSIRNLYNNGHIEYLNETVFILDGPLALFSHAAWFSQAIAKELIKINKTVNLAVIGIEKTGGFAKNFNTIDEYFVTNNEPLKNGKFYFLTNDFIRKYVKKYDSEMVYGEKNYFGKKMYYKNKKGKRFVLNMSFVDEDDKNNDIDKRNNTEVIEKNKRLNEILYLLDNFASQSYPDALSLLSMAHEGAALAANQMAKEIMNNFLDDLFEK